MMPGRRSVRPESCPRWQHVVHPPDICLTIRHLNAVVVAAGCGNSARCYVRELFCIARAVQDGAEVPAGPTAVRAGAGTTPDPGQTMVAPVAGGVELHAASALPASASGKTTAPRTPIFATFVIGSGSQDAQ